MEKFELLQIYEEIKDRILERKQIADSIRDNGSEETFFEELVFCLMTPQTKARQSEKAVNLLKELGLLFNGTSEELAAVLNIVRFRYNKARYIVSARNTCIQDGHYALHSILKAIPDVHQKRQWLVKNITGIGFKEASHFLRNTGYGKDLAILDRHVIRNLLSYQIIRNEPKNLNEKLYLELEDKTRDFAKTLGIPTFYLDYVLWYKEAHDVFK